MNETPPSGPALAFTWDTATASIPLDIDDGVNAYIYGPGSVPVEQVNLTTGSVDYLASAQDGVQTVFNSSGGVLQETNYTTYGAPVLKAGTDVTPFGFQDGYTDPSGAVYLINRYYTPKTDQFISVDPDLAQTGEPYAFTGDDPLNLTDPLGLFSILHVINPCDWGNVCHHVAKIRHVVQRAIAHHPLVGRLVLGIEPPAKLNFKVPPDSREAANRAGSQFPTTTFRSQPVIQKD